MGISWSNIDNLEDYFITYLLYTESKTVSQISRIRNISIAEVNDQDIHQSIVIGIAVIGVSMKILEAMKEKILDFIEENTDAEIINIQEEIESF